MYLVSMKILTEPFKIVLVGDSYGGKTSVVYRMVNQERALPEYVPTVMKTEPVRYVEIWEVKGIN